MNKRRSFNDGLNSSKNAKRKFDKDGNFKGIEYAYTLAEMGEFKASRHILKKSNKDDNMVCLTTWQERKWRQ